MPTLVATRPIAKKQTSVVSCGAEGCIAFVDSKTENWVFWATIVRGGRLYHLCPSHDSYDHLLALQVVKADGKSK